MEYFGRAQSAVEKNKYAEAEEKVNLAVLGSYGANGEIDNKLLKENINKIDGIYEPIGDDEVSSELFEIIVDGYAFTIQKNGQIEGDTELATPKELPKNEKDTEAGTRVQLEESWQGESQAKTTVYAISDGEGNTIPIPKGFYYVGGTEKTGVVISDSSSDKNKGKDSSNGNVTKDLVGNQFVWIPCKEEDYQKYKWGDKYKNNTWDENTPEEEKAKVATYGGFYVARYEAGTSKVTLEGGKKIGQEKSETNNWQNDSYIISKTTSSSKPTSKAEEIPYYHADYETAEKMSERMYNNSNYVSSQLITGTQWDVMLNYISTEKNKNTLNAQNESNYTDLKSNCDWGNYVDTDLTNCSGKYCIIGQEPYTGSMLSYWNPNTEKNNKNNETEWTLLTTGSIDDNLQKKNIYDIAGNLWEWTQEKSNIDDHSASCYMLRGGSFYDKHTDYPVCYRISDYANTTATGHGFRVTLYIK